jgi:hypothetical protein
MKEQLAENEKFENLKKFYSLFSTFERSAPALAVGFTVLAFTC